MRALSIAVLCGLFVTTGVFAQQFTVPYYETIDLYDGFDQNFYLGSNFGVKNPVYSAYPVSGMIRHNRVDGLYLGFQQDKMKWSDTEFLGLEGVNVTGSLGYAFGLKQLQYSAGLEKAVGDRHKWLLLGGSIYNSTATEDYWRTGIFENSFTSFFAGFDYQDYYKADGMGVYGLVRADHFLELGASYNKDTYGTLAVNTDFSLFNRRSGYRINPAIDSNFDLINQETLTLGATLNPEGVARHSILWTTVSLKAELADIGQKRNDFMYNRYQVEAKSYLRLDRSSLLKWRVMAGSITGAAPDFKNFALGGFGSMRALGYKSLVGNEMFLSNLEIEFGHSSKRHAGWVDLHSSLSISAFLDSGVSAFNQSYYTTKQPFSNYSLKFSDLSHNVGIGVGVGAFRMEVARPLAGVQGHTAFWLRFNPIF